MSAFETFSKYLNLEVSGNTFPTPYYCNANISTLFGQIRSSGVSEEVYRSVYKSLVDRELDFGWYLGKGSPAEIEHAVYALADMTDTDLNELTEFEIRNFMLDRFIGIDCSGLVYNCLLSEWGEEALNSLLSWDDDTKQRASRAGSKVFFKSCDLVERSELSNLDLFFIKKHDEVVHVGLVFEDNDGLLLGESTIHAPTYGVQLIPIDERKHSGEMIFGRIKS